MLIDTLEASLLQNILSGKEMLRNGSKMEFLMPSNPLTNFEIQEYYQNKPIFNGVYSRDNSLKK